MTTLLVDIGNTRVKWASLRGSVPGRMRAFAHGGGGAAMRTLVKAAPRGVRRIVAVSVAGKTMERALNAAARARFHVTPEYIRSTRAAHGVRNGYRDTWRLGADRWVSIVGARDMNQTHALLIVNVGTALTIDLLDAAGRHRGGAIAPSPQTMVASLLSGTHGIRRRASGRSASARKLFAPDTASALAAGANFAAASLVDRATREVRRMLGARPLLLLSGGGAADLEHLLESRGRWVPDLVLRGLARFARD
jgi:type III pantothenate kinase